MEQHLFLEASEVFTSLQQYRDASSRSLEALYCYAEDLLAGGDKVGALRIFEDLGSYSDAGSRTLEILDSLGDTIVAWGRNDSGNCDVPAPNAGFVSVAAGQDHCLGVRADGSIIAWGYNEDGVETRMGNALFPLPTAISSPFRQGLAIALV